MNLPQLSKLVIHKIRRDCKGRENAITRDALRKYLRSWGHVISDRMLRDIYSRLPICVCNEGLFWPTRPQEMEDYKLYLKSKAIPLFERYKRVAQAHPHLAPDDSVQGELF